MSKLDIPFDSQRSYSLLRAVRLAAENRPLNGFEGEVSAELAYQSNKSPRGFLVPLAGLVAGPERRALDMTAGASAVATILPLTAIDSLRSRLVVAAAGATVGDLTGGQPGVLAVPRIATTAAATWIGDGSAATAANPTMDQVAFRVNTCTGWYDVSRRMLSVATEDFQNLVLVPDLMASLAHEIDRAAINGTGPANQPLGLLQNAGVPAITITADAGNGGAIAWADLVALESAVGIANGDAAADARVAFVASPQVRSKLRRTDRPTSGGVGFWCWQDATGLLGYPSFATTSVPGNLTKGTGTNLSALLYGNFADLIVNMYSAIDVIVNPYMQSVGGVVRISAFIDVDVLPKHVTSFAKLTAAVTT